jgi:hypothetical protein
MSQRIRILITRREDAPDPAMPSQFFPGAGNDAAFFQVLGSTMPSEIELSTAITAWCDWACLNSYDASSGVGYFHVIDDYAPPAGEIVELEAQSAEQNRRVTIIIERCGKDR